MAVAKLQILGLEFRISPFSTYHDDGYVESVAVHLKQVDRRHAIYRDRLYYAALERKRLHGYCLQERLLNLVPPILTRHVTIWYLDMGFLPLNVLVRGHEETHALEGFKRLDLLADKMLEEQKVCINFQEVVEEEVRAELGGIYAIFARGFHPDMVNSDPTSYFHVARDLYEQSILPEKTIFLPNI